MSEIELFTVRGERLHVSVPHDATLVQWDGRLFVCHNGCYSEQIPVSACARPSDLIYAATQRCRCGAGLAYVEGVGVAAWKCSAVLLGASQSGHDEPLPFAFYELKSERQPSAGGATTRPGPSLAPSRPLPTSPEPPNGPGFSLAPGESPGAHGGG